MNRRNVYLMSLFLTILTLIHFCQENDKDVLPSVQTTSITTLTTQISNVSFISLSTQNSFSSSDYSSSSTTTTTSSSNTALDLLQVIWKNNSNPQGLQFTPDYKYYELIDASNCIYATTSIYYQIQGTYIYNSSTSSIQLISSSGTSYLRYIDLVSTSQLVLTDDIGYSYYFFSKIASTCIN